MKIAFYKGVGSGIFNLIASYCVKIFTGGKYSHVEIIDDRGDGWKWYSASGFDEGVVRVKTFSHNPDNWDIFDVLPEQPDINNEKRTFAYVITQLGKKYDWLGIIGSQLFPLKIDKANKWFCSEICHRSLCEGHYLIPRLQSEEVSPNKLYKILNSKDLLR